VLYPAEERFIREAFTPRPDGSLPYAELVFSCPKKSGKSTMAAWLVLYVIVALAGQYGEAFVVANDFEQARSRVFEACVRIVKASPLLRNSVRITADKITFRSTGGSITAIASDYAGAAGRARTLWPLTNYGV
jgi:phage terminase large subunit-like protein